MADVIEATGLVKHYGDVVALDGLDLAVTEGTVLGMLGPNGAGKTTAVRILTTLLEPDAGRAVVAGHDVLDEPQQVRERIGLSGQYAAVDEDLTGFENLDMIGRLYKLGRDRSRSRARELLERFDLADGGGRPVKGYSGGMRRRLDLAGALVASPRVLVLDEPTTGLDPASRLEMWAVIRELLAGGTMLLLTTQYLEEADQLADEILVIDHGRAIARGTADELKREVGGERVELVVERDEHVDAAAETLRQVAAGEVTVDREARRVVAPVAEGATSLRRALRALDDTDVHLVDVGLRRPTLDDVFLSLTGAKAVHEDARRWHREHAAQRPARRHGRRPPQPHQAQTVVFGATFTGAGLPDDMQKGIIDRFRSLPMSRSAVLVGRTASDVVYNVLSLVIMSLTGLLVGWRVRTSILDAVVGYLLLLVFAYAFSWVMAYVGLVPKVEVINNASFIVIFPMTFIANTFVQPENLPTALRAFANWNPVSSVTLAARQQFGNVIPDAAPPDVWSLQHPIVYTLLWAAAIVAVFLPLSVRQYKRSASR